MNTDAGARPMISRSPAQTHEMGARFGAALRTGDVIGLVGPLGAGKTNFVKGVARGLGVPDDREVASPTFTLVREYEGRAAVLHLDAYRLTGPDDLERLGFSEMCAGGAVVLVEWADRVAAVMPAETVWITIEPLDETSRAFTLSGTTPRAAALGRVMREFSAEG